MFTERTLAAVPQQVKWKQYKGHRILSEPCEFAPDKWQIRISIFFHMDQHRPGPSASLLRDEHTTLVQAHEAGFALGEGIIDGLKGLQPSETYKFLTTPERKGIQRVRRPR